MSDRKASSAPAVRVAAGILALAAAAPWSHASQVLLSSDFDTATTGWTLTPGTSPSVAANTGAESPFTAHSDGKSVLLKDSTNADNPLAATANFSYNAGERSNPLQISFDVNVLTHNPSENSSFWLRNSGGADGIALTLDRFDGVGMTYSDSAGTSHVLDIVLSLGSWYHVTITATAPGATETFDLNVRSFDGAVDVTYTGLSFRSTISTYDYMRFGFNNPPAGSGASFLIDNVLVQTIPTPAALPAGLALLGAAAMGRRRRARA